MVIVFKQLVPSIHPEHHSVPVKRVSEVRYNGMMRPMHGQAPVTCYHALAIAAAILIVLVVLGIAGVYPGNLHQSLVMQACVLQYPAL